MNYRPDIDGLRAVAVLPVVFYHAGAPGPSGGFIGVDVFFVISGYLITTIVAKEIALGRFSLISFYERRARRILPALVAVVLFSFVVGWFLLLPAEMKDLGHSAFATAFFLSNVYFLLTLDYFGPAAEFAPLLHTWSLAVEEQFYLFFPPLLMALAILVPGYLAIQVVAALSLLSLAAAIMVLPAKSDWVFYLIFFRAWELGAGALLALATPQVPRRRLLRDTVAVAALLAILVPVFFYDANMPFPGVSALPPVLGAALLIWIGSGSGGSVITTLLSWRGLVWVGLISYSLYLWHWPLLAFTRIASDAAKLPLPVGLGAVAASVCFAWLSYRFIESPFRTGPPRDVAQRPVLVVAASSLGVMAATGLVLGVNDGVPGRLPAAAVAMAEAAEDRNTRRLECFGKLPADGLCQLGAEKVDGAQVDFLFWGDSHADAIMPGMALAADAAGKRGYFAARSACPPILRIKRAVNDRGCAKFNTEVWEWLETRSDIPLVILGARWVLSVEGTRYRDEAGSPVTLQWTGDPATGLVPDDNASIVEAGLRDTVREIRSTGRRVVLLGPIPEAGQAVPAVAARAAIFGHQAATSFDRELYAARAQRTERILREIAKEHDDVRYLDLSDLFCDQTVCRTTAADGLVLYADDDHITQAAAERMLPPRLRNIWP